MHRRLSLSVGQSSAPVPDFARKMFEPKRTDELDAWMERNGESPYDMVQRGWAAFKRTIVLCLAFDLAILALLGFEGLLYVVPVTLAGPILGGSYAASRGRRSMEAEEGTILKEAPSVVGTMVMSMHVRPSIEGALRAASAREGVLADRLRHSAWKVLAKESEGMDDAVIEVASGLSERNDSVRQALHLLLSTAHESGRESIQRLLDRASRVVIDGVREATDRYVSSLATPTMVLFAVGVLVPVLLFTMVPLQALGSLDLSSGGSPPSMLPLTQLAVIVLVALPMGTLVYARAVLSRNPTGGRLRGFGLRRNDIAAIGVSGGLVILVMLVADANPYLILLAGGLPVPIQFAMRTMREHAAFTERRRWESDLVSGLYQTANRLSCGTSFERALEQCSSNRAGSGFSAFVGRVLHRIRISRTSTEEAIRIDEIRESFPLHWNAFLTTATAADSDPVSAGKVAFSLATNLDDLRSASLKIDDSLRGTVDMMRASSVFFAPLILGVTVGLFGLLQGIGTLTSGTDGLVVVTGIYVLELAAIISYFTGRLRGRERWEDILYDFGTRAPIALMVFISTSALSRSALTQLL
ncbi:MAG: hypothetical protein LUO79_04325 [Methanomassiliicoccales archaeon]|nr:hypothetical protein [Methanomassiliicoccales archaeon]